MKDRPIPQFIAKIMYSRHSENSNIVQEKKLIKENVKPGMNIVDIGCGPGTLTLEMAKKVGKTGKVVALDIHPLSIEMIRTKISENRLMNITPVLTDSMATGANDGSIDMVFIFNTIGMIRNKNGLVVETQRILKDGGRVLIYNKVRMGLLKPDKLFEGTSVFFEKRKTKAFYYRKNLEKKNEK
jgi:ubiquinone/menaquinone biosynthesis C-methylase UbiE